MPRKGRKKGVVVSPLKPKLDRDAPPAENAAQQQFEERQLALNQREVEHRIAAIKAICEAETQNLLSRLRFLRSYVSKEQLQTPAVKFFQENLPNLSVIRNESCQVFELQWNYNNANLLGIQDDGKYACASLSNTADLGENYGLQFSIDSVKKNLLGAVNLQMADFLDEPSDNQILGKRDSYQTPGATCNRLSFGMTPKTLRLPKNGEMLLSVRGSPLGVYKEENLAAIHESGDVSLDGDP